MKRLVSFCCALLVMSVLAMVTDANAGAIKVRNIGRSINQLTPAVPGATSAPWNYSTGLRAIGVFSRAYFTVDTTGSGQNGTPTWAIVYKPSGSTATLDSANGKWINSLKADVGADMYVVSATVGTSTVYDTVFASTYSGMTTAANAGCTCHSDAATIRTAWSGTGHAMIFYQGMTGQLEVARGKGAYAATCIKCHTNGWDNTANNGNFGYLVKQTGWDTTWYQGLEFASGDYWITTGDSSKYNLLSAAQKKHAAIGCEVCHGPSSDHKLNADPTMIGKTMRSDMCEMCHDGSRRHSLGTFYNVSRHSGPPLEYTSNCQPCHAGSGFVYYTDHNRDTTGIAVNWRAANYDTTAGITCQTCHDPHSAANPYQLRTVSFDSLKNGYHIPAGMGGAGLLCTNCHNNRSGVNKGITTTPPYYGWGNRFGPHHSPQADMIFGSNGYQYGDASFTGVETHAGLQDLCVTCHMQDRMNRLDGSHNLLPNHSFSMTDTTLATGVYKPTDVCANCHGPINDFNDIRAFYDYDRNGVIEGVQTEIQGLLTQLKARLPIDSLTGEPTIAAKDSLKVKNHPEYVQGIWNYWFVKNDGSMGVHNAKYTVRLLYKSLGWTPLSVNQLPGTPTEFALNQNYPNPFNPTTNIRFSLPNEQQVKLQVFDITGQLVKTLVDQAMRSGNVEVTWDGTNQTGAKVASGVYLYRMQAGNFVSAKKMVLMK